MSIRKLNEGTSNWSNNMPFPQDRYTLHCVEETLEKSSKGNPMLKRTWEIVAPETVVLGDRTLNIAGQQLTEYLLSKVKDESGDGWDMKKSDSAFGRMRDNLLALGIDPATEIDDENPPAIAKGKNIQAIVYAKESARRKAPTPEQLAAGQRTGDIIKDESGKEVKRYELAIGEVIGLSSQGPSAGGF